MATSKMALQRRYTESRHLTCTQAGEDIRVALEDKNFAYVESEGGPATELWAKGHSLFDIAAQIKRPADETFLILWDLAERGEIEPRPGYMWGVM